MKSFKEYLEEAKKHAHIPSKNQGGDCYMVAYRYLMNHHNENLRLVHGLVHGQGNLEGIVYGHAWVLDKEKDEIYDDTVPSLKGKGFNARLYYWMGKIATSFEYTYEEAQKEALRTGNYGPWNKKILDNPY